MNRQREGARLQADLHATEEALSQNAQYICQQLKENPQISGFTLKVEQERAGLLRLLEAMGEELQARAGGFAGTLCSKVGVCVIVEEVVVRAVWQTCACNSNQITFIIHCVQMEAEAFAQEHLGRVLEEEREASEAVLRIESGAFCAQCVRLLCQFKSKAFMCSLIDWFFWCNVQTFARARGGTRTGCGSCRRPSCSSGCSWTPCR